MFTDGETLEFEIEVNMPFKQPDNTLDIHDLKVKSIIDCICLVIITVMIGASLYFMRELFYKETKRTNKDWKSIGLKESSIDFITEIFDLSFPLKKLICADEMAPVGHYKRSTYVRYEKTNKNLKIISQSEEIEIERKTKIIEKFESTAEVYSSSSRPMKVNDKLSPKENQNYTEVNKIYFIKIILF